MALPMLTVRLRNLMLLCLLLSWQLPLHADNANLFFQQLRPLVAQANANILLTRQKILALQKSWQHQHLSDKERQWLSHTAERYELDNWQANSDTDWQALLARVDSVPNALVLAQAAHESAFGTSRFARQGNSLFGQWCYHPGCGIVPKQRPAGKSYEVQRFDSYKDAIRAYLHNLNTQAAYRPLRKLRTQLRKLGEPLCGSAMAAGLEQYSTDRKAYVTAIQRMIARFKLNTLDDCHK